MLIPPATLQDSESDGRVGMRNPVTKSAHRGDDAVHNFPHLRVAKSGLGLPLKLRVGYLQTVGLGSGTALCKVPPSRVCLQVDVDLERGETKLVSSPIQVLSRRSLQADWSLAAGIFLAEICLVCCLLTGPDFRKRFEGETEAFCS